MILTIAKWCCPNYFAQSKKEKVPLLLCIPYSHFVELSRWALQHNKKPFREVGFAPVQHVLPVLNARINGINGKKFVSSSSVVTDSDDRADMTDEQKEKSRRSRATAVPLLIMPDGTALVDSWSIAQSCVSESFVGIDDQSIKDLYDRQLGPLARTYAYFTLLKKKNSHIWDKVMTHSSFGSTWVFLYSNVMKSTLTAILVKAFDSHNVELNKACRKKLVSLFENELLARVRGRKGRFINGDKLSLEDIALASLACPILGHPNYCEGAFSRAWRELEDFDEEYRRDLEYWRGTEVGMYIYSVYDYRQTDVKTDRQTDI